MVESILRGGDEGKKAVCRSLEREKKMRMCIEVLQATLLDLLDPFHES